MKLGNIDPQVSIDYDTTEKIFEHTVTTADTNAKLLCMFEGADAATTGTADTGQTITFAGTAQIDTAQYKIGTSSLLLDGNSDYVTVPDSTDWDFGTGDFTIDLWVRHSSLTGVQDYCSQIESDGATNVLQFKKTATNELNFSVVGGGETQAAIFTTSPVITGTDTWYHIALVRSGANTYIFVNGVSQTLDSQVIGTVPNQTTPFDIGRIGGVYNASHMNGYIDAMRVTKGTALWTADFTPPTTIDDYVGTSALTIFGLEGDTDEVYMLDVNVIGNGAVSPRLTFNGDSGSNYGQQRIQGQSTTISAGRYTGTYIAVGDVADGDVSISNKLIHAKSGYVRTILDAYNEKTNGTTIDLVRATGWSWNNTADEITSMTIYSSAGEMAVGSTISLYRKVSAA